MLYVVATTEKDFFFSNERPVVSRYAISQGLGRAEHTLCAELSLHTPSCWGSVCPCVCVLRG